MLEEELFDPAMYTPENPAQSLLAPQLVKYLGWPGLFAVLGLAMLSAAVVLRPAVAIEAAALKKKKA